MRALEIISIGTRKTAIAKRALAQIATPNKFAVNSPGAIALGRSETAYNACDRNQDAHVRHGLIGGASCAGPA
jgi:hypothetical protein